MLAVTTDCYKLLVPNPCNTALFISNALSIKVKKKKTMSAFYKNKAEHFLHSMYYSKFVYSNVTFTCIIISIKKLRFMVIKSVCD